MNTNTTIAKQLVKIATTALSVPELSPPEKINKFQEATKVTFDTLCYDSNQVPQQEAIDLVKTLADVASGLADELLDLYGTLLLQGEQKVITK